MFAETVLFGQATEAPQARRFLSGIGHLIPPERFIVFEADRVFPLLWKGRP
jgi:hypothetical protein